MKKIYFDNQRALAGWVGLSQSKVSKHLAREGAPCKTAKGYDGEAVLQWVQKCQSEGLAKRGRGAKDIDPALKDRKLELEIEILQERLKGIQADLVSMEEVEREISMLGKILKSGCDSLLLEIKKITPDSYIQAETEKAMDAIKANLDRFIHHEG